MNRTLLAYFSTSSLERCLTVGFPVWHLGRHFLARHLAPSLSHSLLVEALGLFLLLAARRPDSLAIGGGPVLRLEEWLEEVEGYGKDYGRVLLRGDLAHRLKQPQLQSRRALQTVGGLPEALRGLILAFCCDDLRPPLALALGLTGHRPLHVLRDLHVLDLDHAHLDAPGLRLLVYDRLQLLVYLLAVGKEVVEVLLPKDAPQGGLGDLAGREDVVLYLQDALVGVDHPEVDHRGHSGGNVVAGYDLLGGHLHGYGPQVYLDHPVHERQEDEEPRPLGTSLYPTDPKDHTQLVLLDYLDGAEYYRDDDYRDDHHYDGHQSYSECLQQAQGCVHEKSSFILVLRV